MIQGKPERCRDTLGDEVVHPVSALDFRHIGRPTVSRVLLGRQRRVGLQGWRGAMTGR